MTDTSNKNPDWNFHPDLPLPKQAYWHWPPRPMTVLRFWWENFLQFSDRAMYIVLALAIALWVQPFGPEQAEPGMWMVWALLRNWILLLCIAGGLHMWFYEIDGQGNLMRYDTRPINARKNALFKFGYQTWDNMFYTLVSGAPFATAWEIGIRMAAANGWTAPDITLGSNPIWFLLFFPLLTVWQGTHFYFLHRFLHWPPLYRQVHSVHHRNVNTGPWSGLSMHPVEHALYFSSLLIFFVLPFHPTHVIFLLFWQMLGAPSSHSGYEAVFARDKQRLLLGGFWHHLHHRYYECNYGNPEFPIDRWMGTNHDGTEEMTRVTRARKREMHKR